MAREMEMALVRILPWTLLKFIGGGGVSGMIFLWSSVGGKMGCGLNGYKKLQK